MFWNFSLGVGRGAKKLWDVCGVSWISHPFSELRSYQLHCNFLVISEVFVFFSSDVFFRILPNGIHHHEKFTSMDGIGRFFVVCKKPTNFRRSKSKIFELPGPTVVSVSIPSTWPSTLHGLSATGSFHLDTQAWGPGFFPSQLTTGRAPKMMGFGEGGAFLNMNIFGINSSYL